MARLILLAALVLVVLAWWRPARARALFAQLSPILPIALALVYLASPIDLIPDAGVVGVLDDLIVLVTAIVWGYRRRQGQPRTGSDEARSTSENGTSSADPYAVLGLRPGASNEEVTRAYREKMKLYHPDRVSGLGEELQRVANDKSIEIRRAYETLRSAKSSRA
jgi:uncharacterized membrane protein YkvA (DUF1232 family)